jgi:hypothetical protein
VSVGVFHLCDQGFKNSFPAASPGKAIAGQAAKVIRA